MGSVTLDVANLLWLAGGIAGTYLTNRILSGAPPAIDPNNQRPLVDLFRGLVQQELVAFFGPKPPQPPTTTGS